MKKTDSDKLKAADKPKAPRKSAAKAAPSSPSTIDYPQEGETVRGGHYAVRVCALKADEAQVSIDGAPWLPCRAAVGYFWYDWKPIPGRHEIVVRVRTGKAPWRKIGMRVCDAAA